jgi:hypothetical protein
MNKIKKITLCTLLSAVSFTALYYGALFTLPSIVNLNSYKNTVTNAIEKETGFKVSCDNIYFKRSLTPYLKIHLYHTLVLYPDNEVFLKMKDADLQIKILPLIMKKIVIKDVKLTRPIINITLYKDFSTSLEKYIKLNKSLNTNGFKLDGFIYDTVCENYKIKFNDETINKTFSLEGEKLLLKDFKPNSKLHTVVSGSIYQDKKEYIKYDIDVVNTLNTDKKMFTFSPFKAIYESDIKCKILGHLKIDDEENITGNLDISDLSLKLDNLLSDKNEIKLEFNGKEVNIKSVLHPSKTDVAKVDGNFAFGKKKNIDLKASAKHIKLDNLLKIISAVSKILNLQNPLSDISAQGFLDADFIVNSDFKKLKSSGNLKIVNATVKYNSLPYSVDNINSIVNLNNNKILIENTSLKINQTPVIITGNVNEDMSFKLNAVSNNLNLSNVINIFNLQDKIPLNILNGNLSFDSNITGVLNKSYDMKSNIKLKDLSIKDKIYNLPVNVKNADIQLVGDEKKYKGDILCNNVSLNYQGQKIIGQTFKMSFDENKIIIPENKFSQPFDIKISGTINDYNKKMNGNIDFNGKILSSFLANTLKSDIDAPYKAIGNIFTVGKIHFTKENVNIKSQLRANENNYVSYMVIKELLKKPSLLNLDCDVKDNTYTIKDLSLYEDLNPTVSSYKSGIEKFPKIMSTNGQIIRNKDIEFKNLKLLIPTSLSIATNFFGGEELSLKANLLLNKTMKKPEIKGNISLYKYNLKKYLTSIKNADISLTGDNIRIIAPDVQVNDSLLNVILDVEPSLDFNNIVVSKLQLSSMNLDLNSLFPFVQKEKDLFTKQKFTVKNGVATINKFKALDLKANDISSDFQISNNVLKISNIIASSYGGTVTGKINYDLLHSHLDMNLSGKGIDIKNSLYDLCKLNDNLSGKTDFTAKLSLMIGNYNDVIKSLSGSLKFAAQNGKMGTLGKFEYYLYAQNLLYHGILNATLNRLANTIVHDNTSQFIKADGTVLFQNGYLITEGIQTTGRNMSLFLKGRHNLLSNQSNLDIYGRISDDVRAKLGTFGDVSISEMVNGTATKKDVVLYSVPETITDKIPKVYNQQNDRTNMFKVSIYGNINSVNAINSFNWLVPTNNQNDDSLPDFQDLVKDIN